MIIGYGKFGRSMPLNLSGCGNLGGDVECAAVVGDMARRHPSDTFLLLGRNTGQRPTDVGLPANVINPWAEWGWADTLRRTIKERKLNVGPLTSERQIELLGVFRELTREAFLMCNAHVWWVGQHGTSNSPIPKIENRAVLTKPQDWCAYYAAFYFDGINAWRDIDPWNREEIYLNADPRNRHKMRDLKWPLRHHILTQFTFDHEMNCERYGDPTGFEEWKKREDVMLTHPDYEAKLWRTIVRNRYARLEVNGLVPNTPFGNLIRYDETWEGRKHFGLFINEAGKYGRAEVKRVNVFQEYVAPMEPAWVHGTWSAASLQVLGRSISPAPWDQYYPRLHSVHATLTTPSSGSGWATAKPWEAFAGGTVCFFHPEYDTQNNILRDAPTMLREYLRVNTPAELKRKIETVHTNQKLWFELVRLQRAHFEKAITDLDYMREIEKRIYG